MKIIKTEMGTQDQGASDIDVGNVVHDTLRKESSKAMIKKSVRLQSGCT
jgi:hypothetical protein